QRAVLDEVARFALEIAELGDVLARGSSAAGAAARDGSGPVGVEREGMAVDDAAPVGADRIEVGGDRCRIARRACVERLEGGEGLVRIDLVARGDEAGDDAPGRAGG